MEDCNDESCTHTTVRRRPHPLSIRVSFLLATVLLLVSVPLFARAQSTAQDSTATDSTATVDDQPYLYTVQRGDSWSTVAAETGVPVRALKEANPNAVRASDWLIVGEELLIPVLETQADDEPEIYTVVAGESWNSVAENLGVAVADLKAANPLSLRTGDVLYVGERLVIPSASAPAEQEEPDADGTATDEAEPDAASDATTPEATTPEATATATPQTVTPTAAPTATPEATPEPTATLVEEEEAAAEPTPAAPEESAESPSDAFAIPTEVPAEEDAADADADLYEVQAGESWNSIAAKFGVSAEELREANPELIRPGLVLYRADKLVIPTAAAETDTEDETATGDDADTPATTPEVAATTEPAATAEPAQTDAAVGEEDAPVAAGEDQPAADEADDAAAADTALPACPADFADYPDVVTTVLNAGGDDITVLESFLADCGATLADGIVVQDLTADEIDDVVVLYVNPASEAAALETDLLIFTGSEEGFELDYRAGAAGEVRLLATDDVNADGQSDVIWVDTNCGASTCFDTVMIYSWNGTRWSNWAEDNITMAYADVVLTEENAEGQGREIVLDGGVYGSVGAGPQRSRTETWASLAGEPYALIDTVYADSNCIYHVVLDANRAFAAAADEGFDEAEALYTKAVSDDGLVACWVRDNEIEELQSFSYFRLALIAAYQGLPDVAGDLVGSTAALFPAGPYAEVGDVWLSAYEEEADIAAACDAVLQYLEDAPEAWQILADYGYANPSFTAEDVCPVLDIESPAAADDAGAAPPARTSNPVIATNRTPSDDEDAADEAADTADPDAAASDSATSDSAASDSATSGTGNTDAAALAPCPENVDRFASVLPDVLTAAAGDADAIDGWLRSCGALDDERGGFLVADLNEDGVDDAIFMPTIVSDLGYGPGGSQGAVLIYHADGTGGYDLVYEPDVYGQPMLLAAEDLNADRRPDVAWTVESCSTFCVLEVQMVTWNGGEYVQGIEPGATIAEGTVEFVDLATGAPGQGKAVLLSGGVSGVPDGGLNVPHTENWQSVGGAPYARLEWIYDREAQGNDCVGLRLIEADVAMQAADVLGYDDAIGMYTNALDNQLAACSLFGIPATEELILLQGLASFRLIQAQALDGDTSGADATLLALASGQPESGYTEAATTWLESYTATGNPDTACDAVQSIFTSNDDLWRITDQFGYNHPALAAEQICFRP